MRIGVVIPIELGRADDPSWVLEFARAVESLGFDEVSAVEHSVVIADTASAYPYSQDGRSHLPDDCSLPDPLELLSFIAGATTELGLATGVLVLPNHHPVVLAKRLATLDRLSAGRLRVCLGLGWMREEIEACGGDFDRRGEIADEAIGVMRALWTGTGAVDFVGNHFSFQGAHSWPKPSRGPGVPLFIGGHSMAAARRAGKLGDGFQPLGLAGDDLDQAIRRMKDSARDNDRDPADVSIVLGAGLNRLDESKLEWARSLGADRIVVAASRHATDLELVIDELEACSARLGLTRAR